MSYKDLLRKGMGIKEPSAQFKKPSPASATKALLGIKEDVAKVKEAHWCDECECYSDKPHIHADEEDT